MNEIQKMLSITFYMVEATSTEKFYLWKEFSPESNTSCSHRVESWKDKGIGYAETIGNIDGRPIVLSFTWSRINGKTVAFYEVCSQLADYKMAEEWLKENYHDKYGKPTRDSTCNAMNFSHCLNEIKRVEKIENEQILS